MIKLENFVNEYLIMEYSPDHQVLYCLINKIEGNKIYLVISRDLERTGLLTDDIVKCRIDREQSEYNFKAKISGSELQTGSLNLILTPITDIEQYVNIRGEKRINLRFIAFTDENNLASVVNISKTGMLLSTKIPYSKGEKVKIKLLMSYPSTVCNFIGEVVRVSESDDERKEYGIKITQFRSSEEAKKYNKFINEIVKAFEPI